jgi:CHAT domain-containing protein/tetratricopeptide (TPR) repeat protein
MTVHSRWRFAISLLTTVLGTALVNAADAPAPKAPPRTIHDITTVLDEYKADPEKIARVRAQIAQVPPDTTDKLDLGRFYVARARAAREVGAERQALGDYRKALDYGGGEEPSRTLRELSSLEMQIGNIRVAIAHLESSIEKTPWVIRGSQLGNYMALSSVNLVLGDMQAAQSALAKLESAFMDLKRGAQTNNWSTLRWSWEAPLEFGRAEYALAQGRYSEAEAFMLHALELIDQQIAVNPVVRTSNSHSVIYQSFRLAMLNRIGAIQLARGKYLEAEISIRDGLKAALAQFGSDATAAASIAITFTDYLNQTGRYGEAQQIASAVLRNLERAGTPSESLISGRARSGLAESLAAQGHYAQAAAEYQKWRDALAAYQDLQAKLAAGNLTWSLSLLKTNKPDESLAMLTPLIAKSQQWLGDKHIDTAELVGVKAMALAAKGDKPAALESFRSALPILLAAAISDSDEPSPLRTGRLKLILEAYLGLLGDIRGTPVEAAAKIDAAAEAFRLADALRSQSTQGAVAASALRAAANDPKIGAEIRKEQDLTQEMVALHKILRDLMNAPADQQLPKVIADMKARIETIKKERIALQSDIEKRFPAYANLIRPQPPTLSEARAVLRPNEALINIFATSSATYLWAFKKDGPVAFASTKVNRDELTRRVQGLRKALDPVDADLAKGIPEFDLDAAHRLYADLLLPIAPGWQGAATLLVAANGALSQLPLALLPTQKVAVKVDPKLPYGHFKDVPWLLRQAAFTQLPSVNALVALRKLPAASAERAPFVGFGDPQFSETPIQIASSRGRLRNLNIARPSLRDLEQGKSVEWLDYGKIPPLPDTRDEILALAQALKANPEADVFLGSKASKENLKKLDLAKRKVVAFATHGLLAGDFPGVSEPSLALANPGGGKHGLLTLEDILGLKLDADWVVLSACNTAGGDGEGADALSGLGRGFFYAGSRALLVTHWPVESGSAKTLVTGIFERQAADPKLSRAEALRQSMLALMQSKSTDNAFSYAHPLFWAPYALVGEGGI